MGSIRWAFNFGSWHPTESQFQLASSCIQLEEKNRINKFVFKKDAKASLIGRLLMRKYVNENSTLPYNEIKFERDEKGKPFLLETSKESELPVLNFNVSHQGKYTVLAGEIGNNIKLGVDVMKLEYTGGKSLSEFFRIMTRNFSSQEWATIRGTNESSDVDKLAMFCRHWCLKESYVKAVGTGITVDLQRISFKVNSPKLEMGHIVTDTELYVNGRHLKDWNFEESLIDEEHCVAVAITGKESHNATFRCLDFDELMKDSTSLLPPDPLYCQNFFKKEETPFR
ncbi:L-aminoadipate-semialdehyde dehydrogenase-phosphopantetheinyl transferase [Blattella germanica]|nr:L-aminoadipate-semialdehyde dehydrogenase-phosphopantetheinyl transferase [Blattella germanica]